jgi:transcription-repair coupling factor (superfamily II helicase)
LIKDNLLQSDLYEFLLDGSWSDIIVVKDDKEAKSLKNVFDYFNKNSIEFSDLRASYGDDLRSFQLELFEVLNALREYYKTNKKTTLIIPIRTATIKLPAKKYFNSFELEFAQTIDINHLKDILHRWGYNFVDIIESKAEVSFRGDIIDIFPINLENPIRVSLFDTEIDSIKEFDLATQKSIKEIERFDIVPALFGVDNTEYNTLCEEIENYNNNSILNSVESIGLWLIENKEYILSNSSDFLITQDAFDDISEVYLFSDNRLDKEVFTKDKILPKAKEFKDITIENFNDFIEFHKNKEIEILAKNSTLLDLANIDSSLNFKEVKSSAIVNILGSKKAILSANREKTKKIYKSNIIVGELKDGDLVVHPIHGIGVFGGIETKRVLGATHDFVQITYQNSDKLFIPIENIDIIDRYIANSGNIGVIDKLGKSSFSRNREKVEKKILEIASEIVNMAAQREILEGVKISISKNEIYNFQQKAGFEYTADQKIAVQEILTDLSSGNVMDRLLNGDVGFGKTEVANNSIFATIRSGYQAMLIVPTTILSNQHYHSIKSRLNPFGIKVARVDRYVKPKDKKAILDSVKNGEIDLLIGTHAIINAEFKKLALVIIDEEHKFGVKQKEALKNLRASSHLLSMSATPIPRTLNLALSHLKGMSQLQTPPKQRVGNRTFLKEYNSKLIKEIISRELRRGGQIFYIYNSISTIESKRDELLKLLPNIKIETLHSKVSAINSEKILEKFQNREFELLLSTSIVESGIDFPNANSMIIDGAERFGIADLHQLRGRVGRGDKEGFCYFVVEELEEITQESKKRLVALEQNSHLGSGEALAYQDLEIRGGGNILGEAQSGHIKQVGYSMYLKMLEDSIGKLTNQRIQNQNIDIKLTINAYISQELISEDRVRLELYRRVSKLKSVNELNEIIFEIQDRFGRIDIYTKQFLDLIRIKILAKKLNIISISNYDQNITIKYSEDEKAVIKARSRDDDDLIKTVLNYCENMQKNEKV